VVALASHDHSAIGAIMNEFAKAYCCPTALAVLVSFGLAVVASAESENKEAPKPLSHAIF
jgi:hypothetical protein